MGWVPARKWSLMALSAVLALASGNRAAKTNHKGDKPACSSLDGPACAILNGNYAPRHANGVSESQRIDPLEGTTQQLIKLDEKLWGKALSAIPKVLGSGDDLDGVLDKIFSSVSEAVEELENQDSTRGKYSLSGSYDHAASKTSSDVGIALIPDKWELKPGGHWIMVGLNGRIRKRGDKLELVASLVDAARGDDLPKCSKVTAHLSSRDKRKKHESSLSVEDVLQDSLWDGSYTCVGLKTKLDLHLSRRRQDGSQLPAGVVRGSFLFIISGETKKRASEVDASKGSTVKRTSIGRKESQNSISDNPKITIAGCQCKDTWVAAIKDESEIVSEETFHGGQCGNPGGAFELDVCEIIPGTCDSPELIAGEGWDYCEPGWSLKLERFRKPEGTARAPYQKHDSHPSHHSQRLQSTQEDLGQKSKSQNLKSDETDERQKVDQIERGNAENEEKEFEDGVDEEDDVDEEDEEDEYYDESYEDEYDQAEEEDFYDATEFHEEL
mmetsp:Transcript_20813/g.38729  ORF Transcript_20813/g.38729 Transcript_20813/m.38729 type:complete len:498 (+) Transcript_20813:148-1641(+)